MISPLHKHSDCAHVAAQLDPGEMIITSQAPSLNPLIAITPVTPTGKTSSAPESRETVAGIEVDSMRAWVVCASSCFQMMFVNSFTSCASIFFLDLVRDFNIKRAEASLLTSISFGTTRLFSPISGNLVDRFGCRYVTVVGTLMTGLSLCAASFAQTYLVLLMTQGIWFGIGVSLTYVATICSARQVFRKHASLATGIVLTGDGIGTFIMGSSAQALMVIGGWRVAYQAIAGTIGVVAFFAVPIVSLHKCHECCHPSQKEQKQKKTEPCKITITFDCTIFQSRAYLVWIVSVSVWCTGYFIPYIHMTAYTIEKGITDNGYHIIVIFSIVLTIFRIASGKLLDVDFIVKGQNRFHLMQVMYLVSTLNAALFPQFRGYIGLVAYGVVQGIADGFLTVLTPVLTSIIVGPDKTAKGFGYLLGINSITYTIGPMLAGYIKDMTDTYDYAFYMSAGASFTSFLFLFLIKYLNTQELLRSSGDSDVDNKHVTLSAATEEHRSTDITPHTELDITRPPIRSKTSIFTTESIVMIAETQSKVVRQLECQSKNLMNTGMVLSMPQNCSHCGDINLSCSPHNCNSMTPIIRDPAASKIPSKHPSMSSSWRESSQTINETGDLQLEADLCSVESGACHIAQYSYVHCNKL